MSSKNKTCPKYPRSSDCDRRRVCCIKDYNHELKEEFLHKIRVSAVFDPLTATRENSPFIFIEDGIPSGASVDLLRAMLERIPEINEVELVSQASSTTALEDIIAGKTVLDITPQQITRGLLTNQVISESTLLNQLAFLQVDSATTNLNSTQLFIYRNSTQCNLACSVASLVEADLTVLPLIAIQNIPQVCVDAGLTGVALFISPTNLSGLLYADTLQSDVNAYNINPLPAVGSADQLRAFFDSLDDLQCFSAALLPNNFTPIQLIQLTAQLEAVGLKVIQTGAVAIDQVDPDSVPLGQGWPFLKFASHFGLWLQRSFDEVVHSGEYEAILTKYGLTTASRPVGSLVAPVIIPKRYASLREGFIPRVAVLEAYLPKLACVDEAHSVEITYCEPVVVRREILRK